MIFWDRSMIMQTAREISNDIALYIPRSSDLEQVAALRKDGEKIEGVHYCLDRKSKVIF